jgi:hypothetical protein
MVFAMKAKITLRYASILMFLHDAGHIFGATTWKQTNDPLKREVIEQMTGKKFPFMGAFRSMGQYFDGYGLLSALAMLLIAIIFWIVSTANSQTVTICKNIIIVVSVILLPWGIGETIFFFPFAGAFSLLASILGFYSIYLLKSKTI